MVRRTAGGLLLAGLVGCSASLEPQEGVVLEGFRFGWQGFNHRVSTLDVGLTPSAVQLAVVGGTSTTGVVPPPLDPACEADTCKEFPFGDTADVEVRWARLTSEETAIAGGQVGLEVGAGGAMGIASGSVPKGARGTVVAWISGIHLSTDHPPSGGEACYNPAYGWHPRRILVALGPPARADDTVSAAVSAQFEAGESLEEERGCVDEVNEQAIVDLSVDVTFVVGEGQGASASVAQHATYEYSGSGLPPAQEDPAASAVDFGFVPTAAGFTKIDFSFHVGDPESRGAYLRTWSFWVDPMTGEANGTATNYSPGTQLSGFQYDFAGVVEGVDFPLSVERGTVTAAVEAALDDAGAPVITTLPF